MNFTMPLKAVRLCCAVVALLWMQQNAVAQQTTPAKVSTMHAYFKGKTRPLSELAPMPPTARAKQKNQKNNKPSFVPPNFINFEWPQKVNPDALPLGADELRQVNNPQGFVVEPTVVIEGIDETTTEVAVPDNNGDVSPDFYIEIVNASWFQVFAKDGTPVTPPTSANTIWSQINKSSFSDPVIQYDEAAGRWLITDLGNFDEILYGVSETPDPMGAWNLYTLNTPGLADYPKYGVWPKSYIVTINEGNGVFPLYALNREQMLAGASSIDVQRIEIPGLNGGFPTATPMDWNGTPEPPTDEVFVARMNDDAWGNVSQDQIEVWSILVDWVNPNNTAVTSTKLFSTPFDSDGCGSGGIGSGCIPQPNTLQGLDGIMTIIMNRIVYRNFGTHESAVLTFSVNGGNDFSGIRWMELRRLPGGLWTIYQEGTYAPNDDTHRFISSIAINAKGDIAMGYSVSGANTYPSLRFTGRQSSDPLGEMTVDEYEFASGTGVREGGDQPNRYGDYCSMTVDPFDDSFWFVGEYVKADGSYGTKIVNFLMAKDTFDIASVALMAPQNSPDLTSNETVTIQVKNTGLEPVSNFTVGYVVNNGSPVVEPATVGTLAPDAVYTHSFSTKADMSVVGDYRFKVFSTFSQDQRITNDTLRQTRKKLAKFDASVINVTNLDGNICDPTVDVEVILTNLGTEVLTSANIVYQLNGGSPQTVAWTGNLAPGASVSKTLTLTPLVHGANMLNISTSAPNGVADQIPANDAFSKSFQVVLGGEAITLKLKFDPYPEETSWQLLDANDNLLYEGDNYNGMEEETIYVTWCLAADACYKFFIFDSYGDGMTNPGDPSGSYSISREDGVILASIIHPNFGHFEENDFCLAPPCALAATLSITDVSVSNSQDGAIMVNVSSGAGPYQFSINGGLTFQPSPLFTGLAAGIYNVVVQDASGCSLALTAMVKVSVAVHSPDQPYTIQVAPNPSGNGVFSLQVSGVPMQNQELELQVLDAAGRAIQYPVLTGVNDGYKGIISLRTAPSGIYYVRFKNADIGQLVKLVKL